MADLEAIVRQVYELFDAGDIDAVMSLAQPDVRITQDPRLPWGGAYVGREGVIEFGMKLLGTIETTVVHERIFTAGDAVVQSGRVRGTVRATGAEIDVPECHVWTFRDGLVADVQFFVDSDTTLEVLAR